MKFPFQYYENQTKKLSRKREHLSGNENLVGDRKILELLQSVKASFLFRRSSAVNGSSVRRFFRGFEQLKELFLHHSPQKLSLQNTQIYDKRQPKHKKKIQNCNTDRLKRKKIK